MSDLLSINEADIGSSIIPMIERFDREVVKAEPLFSIQGQRLEALARDLPYHQRHYSDQAAEAKALVKWLENHRNKVEARLSKNYLQGQRAFGARETTVLINGEKEMVEHNQLIIEATLCLQKLDAIVDGFSQMGWMLTNMTKLRVAEVHTAVI
jgi:hypothetical protein